MKLPLLKFTSSFFPNADFSNTLLIACQHILGTTLYLFEELFEKKLRPENVYLIGKCYSTNKMIFNKFVERGVVISEYSKAFDSHISFDEQFQGYIENFFRQVVKSNSLERLERVIVLDDGGYLIAFANDFLGETEKIFGIEQTTSGFEKLKNIDLSFPVLNVARSRAKLEVESPLVAEFVVEKIKSYFNQVELDNPKLLVVGRGYIGRGIADLLKKEYLVSSYDILSHKSTFPGDYKNHLDDFDVIVGATGQTIISPGDFGKFKRDVHLISASSSDREFSSVYLRLLKPKTSNCHKDIFVNGIHLLNSGFPINFDGQEHSLPPEKIQLTRSLLLAAVYEAQNSSYPAGLNEFSSIQDQIVENFKQNT